MLNLQDVYLEALERQPPVGEGQSSGNKICGTCKGLEDSCPCTLAMGINVTEQRSEIKGQDDFAL